MRGGGGACYGTGAGQQRGVAVTGGEESALRYLEGLSGRVMGGAMQEESSRGASGRGGTREAGRRLAEWMGTGCLSPRMVHAKLCGESGSPLGWCMPSCVVSRGASGADTARRTAWRWTRRGSITTVRGLLCDADSSQGSRKSEWVWFELLWRDYYRFVALRLQSKSQGNRAGGLSSRHSSTMIPVVA